MKDTLKDKIRTEYIHKQLVFVHTPKCGGTYATNILKDLGIPKKEHVNYRLSDKEPRKDWPRHLRHVYNNAASLDTIVGRMSDANITGFYPFKSLVYWTKNVDICITINELQEFLALFGYNYDPNNYARTNVSQKKRGTLSPASRARIAKIFKADIDIFNKWTGA